MFLCILFVPSFSFYYQIIVSKCNLNCLSRLLLFLLLLSLFHHIQLSHLVMPNSLSLVDDHVEWAIQSQGKERNRSQRHWRTNQTQVASVRHVQMQHLILTCTVVYPTTGFLICFFTSALCAISEAVVKGIVEDDMCRVKLDEERSEEKSTKRNIDLIKVTQPNLHWYMLHQIIDYTYLKKRCSIEQKQVE